MVKYKYYSMVFAFGASKILVCFIPQQNNTTSAHILHNLYIKLPPFTLPKNEAIITNGNIKNIIKINIENA